MRRLDHPTAETFRNRLLEERTRLLRTVGATEEELATLEAHRPGELAEDAARDEVQAILSRLEGRERHELDEVYAAWARLDAATFGECERCGGTIPTERLLAVPTARRCLACQSREEAR